MIILSFGANLPSVWGQPQQTLCQALQELKKSNIQIISTSNLYRTIPYGIYTPNIFVNAVAVVNSPLPACGLLSVCQRIEAQAGRTNTPRWRSRALDIDIIDYKHLICNWNQRKQTARRPFILPHAHAHKRAFVLRPLIDIAPFWHHPVFGKTALELLKMPKVKSVGSILEDLGPFSKK